MPPEIRSAAAVSTDRCRRRVCRSNCCRATERRKQLAQGKCLVERVSICGSCARLAFPAARPNRAKWLVGGKLAFSPAVPRPGMRAMRRLSSGFQGEDEEQAGSVLETGITASTAGSQGLRCHAFASPATTQLQW